jgi:DNA-binding GntR family transcriptional regulator
MTSTASPVLAPLTQQPAPLRRKIVAALRHAIETGEIKPGARLVEKDLCQALAVSRTSLREALRELQAEGLVSTGPRGTVVTEISPADADNIYQVRASLESLVAAQFAERASEADAIALEKAFANLERAYRSGDFEKILSMKTAFYDAICAGAANQIVRDILDRLAVRINQLRSTSRHDARRSVDSLAELKELTAALTARDQRAARAAALKHITAARTAAGHRRRLASEAVPSGDAS